MPPPVDVDPDADPNPSPFPTRTSTAENRRPSRSARLFNRRGVNASRVFVLEPGDYIPPSFNRQGSSGHQSWLQPDSGQQYGAYGYRAESPLPLQTPERRRERVSYDYQPQPAEDERNGVRFAKHLSRRTQPGPEEVAAAAAPEATTTVQETYYPIQRRQVETAPATVETYPGDDEISPTDRYLDAEPRVEQQQRYDGDDDMVDDGLAITKVYDFTPSRTSRSLSPSPSRERSSAASVSEGEGSHPENEKTAPDKSVGAPQLGVISILHVHRSEYTGDAYVDGSHSVRLNVVHDPKKGQQQPLFRWIHIRQPGLNFDEFSRDVTRIDGLSEGDKNGLAKLLAEVRKTSVQSTPAAKGSDIKQMATKYIQSPLPPDSQAKGQPLPRVATWICIPFFSLQKYGGPLSAANASTFPTQTLLQAQYSGVSRERDMQQVVRQLGHVPPETCFHINQLWCIVLDNSLLVTCGTLAADVALQSDVLDIVTEPPRDPGPGGTSIYVIYTEAVMWDMPLDECQSWFTFVSHFHDFWPQSLCFFYRDRPVKPEDWPRITNLARHSKSQVILYLKTGAPPQPPPRGILKATFAKSPENKDKGNNDDRKEVGNQSLKPPDNGKGNNAGPKAAAEPEVLTDKANDKFHVFSWLDTVTTGDDPSSQVRVDSLRTQLQEVEDYLENNTSFSDRRAYHDMPEHFRPGPFKYLESQEDFAEKFKQRPRIRQDYEDRIDIFNAADMVYRFFLPLGFRGPTVGKFWGAVYTLVQMPQRHQTAAERAHQQGGGQPSHIEVHVPAIRAYLRRLTQVIQSFRNILSHARPIDRATIAVPDGLIRAWLHLLMTLIYCAQGSYDWGDHSEVAQDLIKEGMAEVMEGLTSESLLKEATVLPMEIVSLLSTKLLQDSTGTHPNIGATYSEYMDCLANEIATRPSERSFQHRVSLLKQEIGVILKTVAAQTNIMSGILQSPLRNQPHQRQGANYDGGREQARGGRVVRIPAPEAGAPSSDPASRFRYGNRQGRASNPDPPARQGYRQAWYEADVDEWAPAPNEFYKLSPTDPGGFRELLATECLAVLDKRAREFNEFVLHANDLQEENTNKFEDTKDRQELAIYAFTIVTIIFLPLSFVASVFGMNTSDIRDMELGQWVYWASAIPVTIVVILIGLWLTGELANALTWLGIRSDSGNSSTYALIPPHNSHSSGGRFSTSRMMRRDAAPAAAQSHPPPPPSPPLPTYQKVQEVFVDDRNYNTRHAAPHLLRHRARQYRY